MEKQNFNLSNSFESSAGKCNPCSEQFHGKYYFYEEYDQIQSMVQTFSWYCSLEYQKLIVLSMMASGLFLGFLTNFLIGDSSKISSNDKNNIYAQKSMKQIILCLFIQTVALLCVPLVQQWYQAGIILALWNFGQSFFYSSVYNFIGQKYGTLLAKYSSTIYHTIWSFVMTGFLIFVRFFADWHQIMFYFNGIPQLFLIFCLTIAFYFQYRQFQQTKSQQNLIPKQTSIRQPNIQDLQSQHYYYFDSDVVEYNEDNDGETRNQQTYLLSRFQTEDFLLTFQQTNQVVNETESSREGGSKSQEHSQVLDSYHTNETDGTKRNVKHSKSNIYENLKQKYMHNDITPEQLKQQQEQFIMNSDLNIIDQANYATHTPNTQMQTIENEAKSTKQNIHYNSQLVNNTVERQDSVGSSAKRDIASFKHLKEDDLQNQSSLRNQNNNQTNNTNLTNSNNPSIVFKQVQLEDSDKQKKSQTMIPTSQNQITNQLSYQTLVQLQPTTQIQSTNIQTIKQEMRVRWLQLKRDPSQKLNIIIFLTCWISANITNYSLYISLVFIQGDVYLKLTLCVLIEIISNYIASFILVNVDLKKVILYLFLISGLMCCLTFWMQQFSEALIFPIIITKFCLELFFPIKTYFLQFVLHSQYFQITLGLGDTLSTLLQAFMPLLIYFSYINNRYFIAYIGLLLIFCAFMITQIEMINIYGLNQQFSVVFKEDNKQSNMSKLAEIMEVDSAADVSLYSIK
ncbi:hypothetical protein ABPG72_006977 [Tetrahymena utriculariae]